MKYLKGKMRRRIWVLENLVSPQKTQSSAVQWSDDKVFRRCDLHPEKDDDDNFEWCWTGFLWCWCHWWRWQCCQVKSTGIWCIKLLCELISLAKVHILWQRTCYEGIINIIIISSVIKVITIMIFFFHEICWYVNWQTEI